MKPPKFSDVIANVRRGDHLNCAKCGKEVEIYRPRKYVVCHECILKAIEDERD